MGQNSSSKRQNNRNSLTKSGNSTNEACKDISNTHDSATVKSEEKKQDVTKNTVKNYKL